MNMAVITIVSFAVSQAHTRMKREQTIKDFELTTNPVQGYAILVVGSIYWYNSLQTIETSKEQLVHH
jgi:hypothetical protein